MRTVPKHPLQESCKAFSHLKFDPNYKKMANNKENQPKGGIPEQQKLTERQVELFKSLDNIMRITTNFTGQLDCSKPMSVTNPQQDALIQDFSMGWAFVDCTEVSMPNVNGKGSLFPTSETYTDFSFEDKKKECQELYGLTPDFDFVMREFGGADLHNDFKNYSNIAFVNGAMDPWLSGCVLV